MTNSMGSSSVEEFLWVKEYNLASPELISILQIFFLMRT
jgi:hypothetical protein